VWLRLLKIRSGKALDGPASQSLLIRVVHQAKTWYYIYDHGELMNVYKDLNEAFVSSLYNLRTNGNTVRSRGTTQREILFYSIQIKDPTALSIQPPARKFNPDYAIAEWLWYLSRDPSVHNIGKLASIWLRIQDDHGVCESNYGSYLLGEQWEWVLQELISDRDTRRATMVINQPYHKGKNPEDYPCTQYVHFFIRNSKLHMGVNMRSNDAVFGFCNDVFTFCMFQQLMLNDLNQAIYDNNVDKWNKVIEPISLGEYYHTAGSFHVYETHWKMMNKIVDNYYAKVTVSGWPILNKWKLSDRIISNKIAEIALPKREMEKEEIYEHTTKIKETIYE
jgi:thymidylate synthase